MSPFALVFGWLPGIALVAWGVRAAWDKEVYVPLSQREREAGRSTEGDQEVWVSPFAAEKPPPEGRSIHDFGLKRIAGGVACLLLGVLITAHVYPFAGSRARDTTRVALPDRLLGLPAVGVLLPDARAELKRVAEHEGIDQANARLYAPRFPSEGDTAPLKDFPLLVLAARGDLPNTKIEGGPGGVLYALVQGFEGRRTAVPHGDLADRVYCWSLAPAEAGYGCEAWSTTFFVAVVDQRATSVEEAGDDALTVVAHTVRVKGHAPPDDDGASA